MSMFAIVQCTLNPAKSHDVNGYLKLRMAAIFLPRTNNLTVNIDTSITLAKNITEN